MYHSKIMLAPSNFHFQLAVVPYRQSRKAMIDCQSVTSLSAIVDGTQK